MKMKIKIITSLCVCLFLWTGVLPAQSIQKFAELGDFKLESGEYIYDCKIGYRTFGALNEEKSNAILNPTWFAGTSEHLGNLIGTGQNKLLDSSKYFIITIDAIGNGVSTSPSNALRQPKEKFPNFTIRDIVNSQYELITEVLGLNHLYAAIGGSMGSMQVLQWAVSYPDFVDKIVVYVPTPWSSSYDMLVWSTRFQIIESAHRVNMPEKDIMKSLSMLIQSIARTPDYFVKNNPREKFDEYLKTFDREPSKTFTSYDYASQLRAMINHDISKNLESKEKLKDIIKAKVFLIISLQDHILHPQPALDFAELINAEKLVFDSECGHLAVNCEMEKCAKAIAEFLK